MESKTKKIIKAIWNIVLPIWIACCLILSNVNFNKSYMIGECSKLNSIFEYLCICIIGTLIWIIVRYSLRD